MSSLSRQCWGVGEQGLPPVPIPSAQRSAGTLRPSDSRIAILSGWPILEGTKQVTRSHLRKGLPGFLKSCFPHLPKIPCPTGLLEKGLGVMDLDWPLTNSHSRLGLFFASPVTIPL